MHVPHVAKRKFVIRYIHKYMHTMYIASYDYFLN